MSSPNSDARSASNKDGRNPVGICPLKENKIQLVPVRYAITEQKPQHPAIASKHASLLSYRPIGIRPLIEDGYLYVIHSKRQEIIYVYKVSTTGAVTKLEQLGLKNTANGQEYVYAESESALVVERAGSIEVLYSRVPISPKLQRQLLSSSKLRSQLMQRCSVGSYECVNGATHLLPPDQLADHLADCHPEQSRNTKDFQWRWMVDPVEKIEASTITEHILGQYKQDSAILILEDPIGVMNELAGAYIAMTAQEIEWLEKDENRAKYFAASHINLLIEVTERHLLANSSNKKISEYIQNNPDKAEEYFYDYRQAMKAYEEDKHQASSAALSRAPQHFRRSRAYINLEQEKKRIVQLAKNIGVKPKEIFSLFNRTIRQNNTLRNGDTSGKRGVLERIRHDEMQAWYADACEKVTLWLEEREKICADRTDFLPIAYKALPVYDKENVETFKMRLAAENHWLVGLTEFDEHLSQQCKFFFHSLGEQNLHLEYVKNEKQLAVVEDYDSLTSDAIKLYQLKKGKDGVDNALQDVKDFRSLLDGSALVPMENPPDDIRVQMNRFGAQLAPLALKEFRELQADLARNTQRINNIFRHAKPGLTAILLGQAKNAQVTIDIGPKAGVDRIGGLIDEMERTAARYNDLVSERNKVEEESRGLTKDQKKQIRLDLNEEISRLGRDVERLLDELGATSTPIASQGEKYPSSHVMLKAAGLNEEELKKWAKHHYRLMKNQILYGSEEGFKWYKPDGAVKSASLGLVFFIFAGWNWCDSYSKLEQKSEWTDFQKLDFLGSTAGMLASGLGVAVEIARTSTLLEWVESGKKGPQMLCGKIITIGTLVTASLGVVSVAVDGFKQGKRLIKTWRQGDVHALVGTLMALGGDGIQIYHTAKLARYTSAQIKGVVLKEIFWDTAAERILSFAGRLSSWMWWGSALVFVGEIIYNSTQSTPLMIWVGQSSWGQEKRGLFWGGDNKNWDYETQLLKWQEVMQTPRLFLTADENLTPVEYDEPGYYTYHTYSYLSCHSVTKLRIVIPMTQPQQVQVAAFLKTSDGEIKNITSLLVNDCQHMVFDGMNTICEWLWPAQLSPSEFYQYLDLMVSVTNQFGDLLFAEQGGARFTLNLQQIDQLDAVPQTEDWYQAKLLEESDQQMVGKARFEDVLIELKPVLSFNPVTGAYV
ncbi:toxin VasX [Photobacterium sp. J15]|uniref:toxin VasX n=1 Tax=Photobacterium sp. J15 TaxID=265901 RepID=UPI0007E2E18C|nr:toxin VasX [Photobacterium sp. J15]